MTSRNVLFLCTHNSARSILAEAILNSKGGSRFHAYSAGSAPAGGPNPDALALLTERGHSIERLHSKSWDVFAADGAPPMHIIITVCDNAAGESCPVWPGRPASAHWGIADPSSVSGDVAQRRAAFAQAYSLLEQRIDCLLSLPETLERPALNHALTEIGSRSEGATEKARAGAAA